MTGQWEQYVEAAEKVLARVIHERQDQMIDGHIEDDAAALAEAVLATIGPLIAEDTRVRMVEAAAEIVKREGVEDLRAKIVADLRWLAEARKDYCHRCPEHQGDMHDMGPTALAVHDDHDAAERLADILDGSPNWKGWLPSWRWDEWRSRQA